MSKPCMTRAHHSLPPRSTRNIHSVAPNHNQASSLMKVHNMNYRVDMTPQAQAEAAKESYEQAQARQQGHVSAVDRVRVGYNGEPVRFTAGGTAETIHGGTTSVQLAVNHDETVGVLASATQAGSGRPAQVIDGNTLVRLPNGMQTSVAAAVAIGALIRNSDGSYSETGR
jgi:hypothetical protein